MNKCTIFITLKYESVPAILMAVAVSSSVKNHWNFCNQRKWVLISSNYVQTAMIFTLLELLSINN